MRSSKDNIEDMNAENESVCSVEESDISQIQCSNNTSCDDIDDNNGQGPSRKRSRNDNDAEKHDALRESQKFNALRNEVYNNNNENYSKKKQIKDFRNDLKDVKNMITGRKELKFAWLGNLVAAQMENIDPENQNDAAWQIQCLMRKLTRPSKRACSSSSKNILDLSMQGIFEEEGSIEYENIIEEVEILGEEDIIEDEDMPYFN
ncbi:uncharacterized protein [Musca autumnalis]|uniref:uncharacterized protein n=1 Tax=Musca autumnalis TaxID=221902 RepID=UPI003CEB019B